MLITIDIGNTNITMGIYHQDQLIGTYRLTTKFQRTSDEYGFMLLSFLSASSISADDIQDIIISSVVPKINYSFTAPGIGICANALSSQAAKLPEIEIQKPERVIAKNTIKSMQAGVFFGYIGQTEYLIKQIKKEYQQDMKVISTGGLGRMIAKETDFIDIYDADLTFKGLKIIYDKTKKNLYEKQGL